MTVSRLQDIALNVPGVCVMALQCMHSCMHWRAMVFQMKPHRMLPSELAPEPVEADIRDPGCD